MVCRTFASLFGLVIISGEASPTLQPCRLKIPYGLTETAFKKRRERERGESSMVCQTFASLFGLWIISGEASSTLHHYRLKIPYGLTKNSFQKVKERVVNQAWCVRLLQPCRLKIPYGLTKNSFQEVKERER